MTPQERALAEFESWYRTRTIYPGSDGPAKGTIGGALVVLDHLKTSFDLNIDTHTAEGGTQIRGASGLAVKRVLAEFGETRRYVSEGGRTNRGLRADMVALLEAIQRSGIGALAEDKRNSILEQLQQYLVDRVREFHDRQRITFRYDPAQSAWQSIRDILDEAKKRNKEGQVAQYLVGAKLQLRFPDIEVRNTSYSTADQQQNVPGDFLVGDTAFHVTVAPMLPLFEKCCANVESGRRVYILVPEAVVAATRPMAERMLEGRLTVASIESFVAQNLEELSGFSEHKLAAGFHRLLEMYNKRTRAVELDLSLLIEIPENIRRHSTE